MTSTTDADYFDTMWDCSCPAYLKNGQLISSEFVNFWEDAGECCDRLRFTVWIVFNIALFLVCLALLFRVSRERVDRLRRLNDFRPMTAADREEKDRTETLYSSIGDIKDPFIG